MTAREEYLKTKRDADAAECVWIEAKREADVVFDKIEEMIGDDSSEAAQAEALSALGDVYQDKMEDVASKCLAYVEALQKRDRAWQKWCTTIEIVCD